jgi:hypothetical protein
MKLCGPTVGLGVFEKQSSPASAGNRTNPRCLVTTPTVLSRAISIMFGPNKNELTGGPRFSVPKIKKGPI